MTKNQTPINFVYARPKKKNSNSSSKMKKKSKNNNNKHFVNAA